MATDSSSPPLPVPAPGIAASEEEKAPAVKTPTQLQLFFQRYGAVLTLCGTALGAFGGWSAPFLHDYLSFELEQWKQEKQTEADREAAELKRNQMVAYAANIDMRSRAYALSLIIQACRLNKAISGAIDGSHIATRPQVDAMFQRAGRTMSTFEHLQDDAVANLGPLADEEAMKVQIKLFLLGNRAADLTDAASEFSQIPKETESYSFERLRAVVTEVEKATGEILEMSANEVPCS
jgi:hypothetical protein